MRAEQITVNGQEIETIEGIKISGLEKSSLNVEIPSGQYSIVVKN